jgi:hypothetical protein
MLTDNLAQAGALFARELIRTEENHESRHAPQIKNTVVTFTTRTTTCRASMRVQVNFHPEVDVINLDDVAQR